jgi:hypothetical protein
MSVQARILQLTKSINAKCSWTSGLVASVASPPMPHGFAFGAQRPVLLSTPYLLVLCNLLTIFTPVISSLWHSYPGYLPHQLD